MYLVCQLPILVWGYFFLSSISMGCWKETWEKGCSPLKSLVCSGKARIARGNKERTTAQQRQCTRQWQCFDFHLGWWSSLWSSSHTRTYQVESYDYYVLRTIRFVRSKRVHSNLLPLPLSAFWHGGSFKVCLDFPAWIKLAAFHVAAWIANSRGFLGLKINRFSPQDQK
jgi:hypothetical protein